MSFIVIILRYNDILLASPDVVKIKQINRSSTRKTAVIAAT